MEKHPRWDTRSSHGAMQAYSHQSLYQHVSERHKKIEKPEEKPSRVQKEHNWKWFGSNRESGHCMALNVLSL